MGSSHDISSIRLYNFCAASEYGNVRRVQHHVSHARALLKTLNIDRDIEYLLIIQPNIETPPIKRISRQSSSFFIMFKRVVYLGLLAGAAAQSNGTIGLSEPEAGEWGSNIGKAATKHYNDIDREVFRNDTYTPQPARYDLGSDFTINENTAMDRMSPDTIAPPTVDFGSIENPRWHMSDSYNRLAIGGFARQQTVKDLPISKDIAGVDMRLSPHAFRESHWHTQAEWSYIFSGRVIISAILPDGKTFISELGPGDVWFFPPSSVHSIQALDEGAEFLLIFDSGEFDENSTFLAAEALSRIPKSVIKWVHQFCLLKFSPYATKQQKLRPEKERN